MKFIVGNVKIKNRVVLAPMAGVSNSPFRKLVKKFGAGLVFSEMVSDKGLMHNNKKSKNMLYIEDSEKPVVQQIFGSNIETMVAAAEYIDKNSNCDIIDINMGCPVPKVAIKAQAGSALMKNEKKIYEIVKAVVRATNKPISVKIRSGWDEKSVNAVSVAKEIERAGASLITIHARTRSQGYSGEPDLDVIKNVVEAVNIPVIGNGNIIDGKSAKYMLDYTKCDAVMIGRAALGNPWIFREVISYLEGNEPIERPSKNEVYQLIIEHMNELIKYKGEKVAILEMRGHAPWYLKGYPNSSTVRKKLSKCSTALEVKEQLQNYFDELK